MTKGTEDSLNLVIGHLKAGCEEWALPAEQVRPVLAKLMQELGEEADDEHYQVYVINSRNEAITVYDGGLFVYSAPNISKLYYKPGSYDEAIEILTSLPQRENGFRATFASSLPIRPAAFSPVSQNEFPLHASSNSGNLRVLKRLVEGGRDVNQADLDGATPIMHAAIEGHYAVCRYLIEHGADLSLRDNDGESLWDLAREHPSILALLTFAGERRRDYPTGDQNVYAVFDNYALYDLTLPPELWSESNVIQFTYLDKLIDGKVEGYTWHHHQEPGRMQLIPSGMHQTYRHRGGRYLGNWAYVPGLRD